MTIMAMVIIVALQSELPPAWRDHPVIPIVTRNELEHHQDTWSACGVMIIVSGVGRANVVAVCDWIKTHRTCPFVVNMGSAGALSPDMVVGQWFLCDQVRCEGYSPLYARNQGIMASSGQWIAFLDSDDAWTPTKLADQLSFLRQYPFYRAVQSEEVWIKHGRQKNQKKHHQKTSGWLFDRSLHMCAISPSCVMIHRHIFQQIGLFNTQLPVCEDYSLWLNMTRWFPVGLVPRVGLIKYAGETPQLSEQYAVMDRYRIASLASCLAAETYPGYQDKIATVLKQKCRIVWQGAMKRQDTTPAMDRP